MATQPADAPDTAASDAPTSIPQAGGGAASSDEALQALVEAPAGSSVGEEAEPLCEEERKAFEKNFRRGSIPYDRLVDAIVPLFAKLELKSCAELTAEVFPPGLLSLCKYLGWTTIEDILKDVFSELEWKRQQEVMMALVEEAHRFKAMADAGSKACAKCGVAPKDKRLPCDSCQLVVYCSRGCKKDHHKLHKKSCAAATKAMAEIRHVLPPDVLQSFEELKVHAAQSRTEGGVGWDTMEGKRAILGFKKTTREMEEWRKDALFVSAMGFQQRHVMRSRKEPDLFLPKEMREDMEAKLRHLILSRPAELSDVLPWDPGAALGSEGWDFLNNVLRTDGQSSEPPGSG